MPTQRTTAHRPQGAPPAIPQVALDADYPAGGTRRRSPTQVGGSGAGGPTGGQFRHRPQGAPPATPQVALDAGYPAGGTRRRLPTQVGGLGTGGPTGGQFRHRPSRRWAVPAQVGTYKCPPSAQLPTGHPAGGTRRRLPRGWHSASVTHTGGTRRRRPAGRWAVPAPVTPQAALAAGYGSPPSSGRMNDRSYRSTQPLSSRILSAAMNAGSTPNKPR